MAEVERIAVIGAGHRGRSIAYAAALGGYRVILEDILPASLRKAEAELREFVEDQVRQGTLLRAAAGAAVARLEYAGTVEQAARVAAVVIEAVPDELESKLEIFTLLDKICPPSTILVLNSDSLTVSEIATATYRAPLCIRMRFSEEMKRIEVIRGRETDEPTAATVLALAKRLAADAFLTREPDPKQSAATR